MAARQQRRRPGERRGRLHEQPAAGKLGLRGGDGLLGDLDDAAAARAHGGEDLGAAGRPGDRDALRHGRAGLDRRGLGRARGPRPRERWAALALHGDQRGLAVDQARGMQLAKAAGGPEQERAVADGEDQRLGGCAELLPQLERVRLGALEEVRVVDVRGVHGAGGADGVDCRLGRGRAVARHELYRRRRRRVSGAVCRPRCARARTPCTEGPPAPRTPRSRCPRCRSSPRRARSRRAAPPRRPTRLRPGP